MAVTQGLWPPTTASNTTLANGTTIVSPFNGYQYVGVSSIDPEEDYTLEPWTECPAYTADNAAWYKSDAFKAKAAESQDFLTSIQSVVGSRNVSLENMWNIFDYINVNYVSMLASSSKGPYENIIRRTLTKSIRTPRSMTLPLCKLRRRAPGSKQET